jgi:TonB family protein
VKCHRMLLLVAIAFLIFPNHAASQNKQKPSAMIQRLIKAAEKGNAMSQFQLANAYLEGRGVQQNYVEAAKWYRKAAEQGHIKSQSILADLYYLGRGVNLDRAEAVKWGRKVAEQGDVGAQRILGETYLLGRDVPQDYAEAMKWYRKAAEQGDATAQFGLGSMYADGKGDTQDYIKAHMWLTLSAARLMGKVSPTFKIASDLRGSIVKNMTPQQIEEADRLAKEWEAGYAQKMVDGPYVVGNGVTPPVVLVNPAPLYTEQARKACIEGTIIIECVVRKDGTVNIIRIVRGLGHGLDESAIFTIVTKWRFKPGTRNGVPVDVLVNVDVSFLSSC